MSAERTVASPAAQPRAADHAIATASVIPPRGAGSGRRTSTGWGASVRRSSALPLVAVDCSAALLATVLLTDPQRHPLLVALLLTAVTGLNARAALYRRLAVPSALDELPSLAWQTALSWGAVGLVAASFSALSPLSLTALCTAAALQSVLCCTGRGALYWWARRATRRQPRPALVVGPAPVARRVAEAVLRHPQAGVRPVGIVDEAPAERTESEGAELPVLSTIEELRRAVIQNAVRTVLVVGPTPGPEQIGWLRTLSGSGCDVWAIDATQPPGYDAPGRQSRSGRLAGFPCRSLVPAGRRHFSISKRALDLGTSGILLLLISPVLLACAAVLRASDGPGVIFRQERIGKGGRPFTLLKFRTHRPADPHEAATRWTVAGEQHMSPFCQFLRRTSLDELPQLWNVCRGDMSLVGPRPERPYFVGKFSQTYPGYAERHRMPTGITGLAQIQGLRGDTSIEDRCRFDNAYIDSWSFWQDLCILLRTAASLVRPTGS
ncbi:exopolysaccharide biosynthesis polyprenyl glycosylphosphotransferase [Streptomyces durmitorensis]|uniref:Sugar transferase n=1 Tax=Streptomyces durmitorensis TaxID=319947 RepID=A0ABY4PTX8_9ACTN|nr:sugar transferase [Streptomyces durmitorensis]UQT56545.1 sugar transferase [Streptomyces durmitorensis]